MEKKDLPIGFMDSGLGGLSVLKEALRIMPYDDFIYYGDSRNAPYGVKDQETIRRLTFQVVEMLLERGIKGLAIACNTATSAAVAKLRLAYPQLPIVGIEPAVKPAVEHNHGGRILVMATPMTIRQEKFHKLLERYRNGKEVVPVPCEGLMEFVEHGELDGDTLEAYFREHLTPYLTEDTETIVLGCTHYPLLRTLLRGILGEQVTLVNPAEISAEIPWRTQDRSDRRKPGNGCGTEAPAPGAGPFVGGTQGAQRGDREFSG